MQYIEESFQPLQDEQLDALNWLARVDQETENG
jgi:hypothetical protein